MVSIAAHTLALLSEPRLVFDDEVADAGRRCDDAFAKIERQTAEPRLPVLDLRRPPIRQEA